MSFHKIPTNTPSPMPRFPSDKKYKNMLDDMRKSREEAASKAEQALLEWENVYVPREVDLDDNQFKASHQKSFLYNVEELGAVFWAILSLVWFGIYAAIAALTGGKASVSFGVVAGSLILGAITMALLNHADKSHFAKSKLKQAKKDYEDTFSPYWQTHRKRPHAAALPEGTHNTYAVHVEHTRTGERLHVVEYRDIGPLQRRVIETEDVLPDVGQAELQAVRLAEHVRELETQSWRAGQEQSAEDLINGEIARERLLQSQLTEQQLKEQTIQRRAALTRTLEK